jgi:hypothetical protein
MKDPMHDRRGEQRCIKDVGMQCTLLNGNVTRPVTLRNYSINGLFFETAVQIKPGTFIVLRSADANEARDTKMSSAGPSYSLNKHDPEVCSLFRSHTVAKVKRCELIDGHDESSRYGVFAEIQRLTD